MDCCSTLSSEHSKLLNIQNLDHLNSSKTWHSSSVSLSANQKFLVAGKCSNIDPRRESISKERLKRYRSEQIFYASKKEKNYARDLRGLIELKRIDEALDLYFKMKHEEGCEPGVVNETMLIDLLMKFDLLQYARKVFDKMPDRNVVTWTSMISGCVHNGCSLMAIHLFIKMLYSDTHPNEFTCNAVIQASTELLAIDLGQQLHSFTIRNGIVNDCRIGNCLIDLYCKCNLVETAWRVFIQMFQRDIVSFTSMIAGFCKNDLLETAFILFDRMRMSGLDPNEHTFTSLLSESPLRLGEQLHAYMIKTRIDRGLYAGTNLIEFYSKQNLFEKAIAVFDRVEVRNVVTWSTIISCSLQNNFPKYALNLFGDMIALGYKPNEFTFASAIATCGCLSQYLTLGLQLHCLVIKLNLESDNPVYNSLLTMYSKYGRMEDSEKLFDKIHIRDTVTWSALISGYFHNGFYEKAVDILCEMQHKGAKPNEYSFSTALTSCANLVLLNQGRQFHCFLLKLGCGFDVCVGNSLINLYSKCGRMDDARLSFDEMLYRDIMSWNTLIHGYAHHGYGVKALQVFETMLESIHLKPDHATLVGVLNACSHTGSINEAIKHFISMETHYEVIPLMVHYACIVDMLGRAGRLSEAARIIESMPFQPDSSIWKSLLGSCRIHKNLYLGEWVGKKAIELSSQDSANYVLLSNLYSECGKPEDASRMRKIMEERGVRKEAGWSWIEIRNEIHTFIARDESHSVTKDICNILEEIVKDINGGGYSIDPSFTLYDS